MKKIPSMPHKQHVRSGSLGLVSLFTLMLMSSPVARADIGMKVWVRLITSGQCKVKRTTDTNGHTQVTYETLDCRVYPEDSKNSYYFETKLEGNVIDQLVDGAMFSKDVYDFASDVAAAAGSGGSAAALAGAKAANDARAAYGDFSHLMDGWGGTSNNTQAYFFVAHPYQ